jgi:hypothetical protein
MVIGGVDSMVWVTKTVRSAPTVSSQNPSTDAFDVGITVKRGDQIVSGEKLILNVNDADIRISTWGAPGKERLIVVSRGGVYLFRVEGCKFTQLRGPGVARDGSIFSVFPLSLWWGSFPWSVQWVCNPITDTTQTIKSYGSLKTTYRIENDELVVVDTSTQIESPPPPSSCGTLTL